MAEGGGVSTESWARFGDQDLEWDVEAVARAGSPALVTQVGRSFQLSHPEVPVLLDHGRHLVIAISEAARAALEEPDGQLHWTIVPLPAGTVVVDRPQPVTLAADRSGRAQ